MTQKNTKYLILVLGGITGIIITAFLNNSPSSFIRFDHIWLLPGSVVYFIVDLIMTPLCKISETNICRGLSFDGGPLEWIEWLAVYSGMIIGYALIFLSLHKLFNSLVKIKK